MYIVLGLLQKRFEWFHGEYDSVASRTTAAAGAREDILRVSVASNDSHWEGTLTLEALPLLSLVLLLLLVYVAVL